MLYKTEGLFGEFKKKIFFFLKNWAKHMTPNKCFINVSDNDDDQGDSITHYFNKYLLGAYVYITVQIFQDGLYYL